ncbi:MAG: hypothetical protein JNL42_17000, partial [Anaerolineae bacterium]|nr:hypothetical protein [Anaerolineae bacterium]
MKTNTRSPHAAASQAAGRPFGVLLVLFLLAAVGLAYEITLTRVFSVILQYHFVFLVVSLAVAGLSGGAALATLLTRGREWDGNQANLTNGALLTALLLVGAAVVLALLPSAELIGAALAAAFLPFVGIGFLLSVVFAAFAQSGGVLYAADLLGGAFGLAAAFAAISLFGAFDLILALAVIAAGVGCLLAWSGGDRSLVTRALILTGALAVGFLANRFGGWLVFSPAALENAPPDKTMIHMLQSGDAALLETRWDPFARLDVVTADDDSLRYVFTDAGAGSIMVRYAGDDAAVDWMRRDVEYLPFAVLPEGAQTALIIGAGAGRDVLMAKLAGLADITAVEINPTLVDLTRDSAEYNGGIFDLPNVQTVVTDGRNFVERSGQTYDLIYANVVYSQAAAPGHSALAESYIFTREALRAYWGHLTEDGTIAFATHHGIEGLRLVVAALDMLQAEGMGVQEALRHVALGSRRSGDAQTRTSVVFIRRQPFDSEDSQAVVTAAHDIDVGMLYLPGFQEVGMTGLANGVMTLQDYIDANADQFNYTPTTDDSPFFYQFAPGLPPGVSDLLLVSIFIALAYLSWAIFFYVRRDGYQWRRALLTPYFALLGAAYMLVEIPLIQRFNLLLGQPTLALPLVIGALLMGSGLGSLLSSRFSLKSLPRRVALFALLVAAGVVLSLIVHPALIRWALPLSLEIRLAVTVVAILPLGFLMGVPFPGGLRIAHEADPRAIAAFWGANAATAILGSALAMTLAV